MTTPPGTESGPDPYGQAALALVDGDTRVYVSPEAVEDLGALAPTAEQIRDLRTRVDSSGVDTVVAVLPASAAPAEGSPPQLLYEATRLPGTYLVVLGDGTFDAGSTDFAGSRVDALATEAWTASGGDLGVFLTGFVTRVEGLGGGDRSPPDGGPEVDARTVGLGAGALGLLLLGSVLVWRRNRRRAERADLGLVRPVVEGDLAAAEADLQQLRADLEDGYDQAAAASTARAERALERARHALGRSDHADELRAVTAALAEAGWYAEVARERADGRDSGPRRPPCFFDPAHRPSVTEVSWAPSGGVRRPVPACADDARLDAQGLEPSVREVPLGRGLVGPYHEAGVAYRGWAWGYHGAAVPALLADTALGAAAGGQHLLAEGGFDAVGGWSGGRGIEEERG